MPLDVTACFLTIIDNASKLRYEGIKIAQQEALNLFGNPDEIPYKFQETNLTDSVSIFDKTAKTDGKKR